MENIYRAHRDWNWSGVRGRESLPTDYVDQLRWVLLRMSAAMCAFLKQPVYTR